MCRTLHRVFITDNRLYVQSVFALLQTQINPSENDGDILMQIRYFYSVKTSDFGTFQSYTQALF